MISRFHALTFFIGDKVKLHIGQLQTPAEKMIGYSINKVLLIDRPRMSEMMGSDKDIGAMVEILETPDRPAIRFGLFNGNGKGGLKGDKPLMKTARIEKTFGPISIGAYGFVNSNISSSTYLSKTLSANLDPYKFKAVYGKGNADEKGWGADCWYTSGKLDLRTGYSTMKSEDSLSTLPTLDATGFYVEAGYFFGKRNEGLQAVAGYQEFDPNRVALDVFDLKSTTVGLNWYKRGFEEMARVNYEFREEGPGGGDHGRFVLQYQLMF